MSMRDKFVQWAASTLDADPNLAVILADIGAARFDALGTITRHPDRLLNVGIREALAVGAGAGMALEGFHPVLHSYAPFLVERAFEQIKLDFVHQGLAGTLVTIGASYDASTEGRTHQCPADVALLATLPDMHIEVPGHRDEVQPILHRLRQLPNLSYVRLSVFENSQPFTPGVHIVREGQKGTVLTIGPLLRPVLEAASALDLRVLYTSTARPLDAGLFQAVLPKAPVAVVEPVLEGTSTQAVISRLGGSAPVTAIGVQIGELRRYGTPEEHAAAHGLDAVGLHRRLRAMLEQARLPA